MESSTAPLVDYSATSRRPSWSELPIQVREAVGVVVGSPVVHAAPPVSSGFTGSYAGQVACANGRTAFAKAAGPTQPFVVAALEQEASVLPRLPPGISAPELVGFRSVGDWSVLVLEVVSGWMPGQPWTGSEVDAVHRACLTIAELGTPSALGERGFADGTAADPAIVAVAAALVEGSFRPSPALPGWLPRYGDTIGRLVLRAAGSFSGETLCHGDLRPDNLLVAEGRASVLDWNWVGTAAAWVDWVGLLPLMALQGVDTDGLLASSPLTRHVDEEAMNAFVACIALYMVAGFEQDPPPGCTPALRRHQLLMAHAFLEFLRRRRRWAR